ncbi:MAG: 16S rRNA (cytidine(1402)-2'-O)-methyltransferase [Selenomonadaceae bacterium]|nr:16S rRNA (cytidine(1402)-2'-O)-methyltransferase [Selenomonadaceae bacterium]
MKIVNQIGILYLCATPIGNLEDMTFRAVKILKEVDFIAAEDTRHTRKLLAHFDIHTPLIRYDEFSKTQSGEKILNLLREGKSVACVSDAGLPAISDPGADLVKLTIEAGIKVCPIPGANAALSALICSALDTTKFTFVGFLPKTAKNRHELLTEISTRNETLIFYESPHHLKKTLYELLDVLGNRNAVLARELTKIHEEFLRGTLEELAENLNEPIGEFVIVVEGKKNFDEIRPPAENFIDVYKNLIFQGVDKKSAIREVAKKFNLSRRDVYNAVINI